MHRQTLSVVMTVLASAALAEQPAPKLGYVGQTTSATRIYSSPSNRSRIYSRVDNDTLLVVRPSNKIGWYAVLLRDGKYGYVSSAAVKELPYEVTPHNYSPQTTDALERDPGLASRSGMAADAVRFIGAPYKWGGTSISDGIDCSAFVKKMYGKIGIDLPRTAAEQVHVGTPIYRYEDLQAGDRLYFWDSKRGMIGHTGIFQGWDKKGNGIFIHSSHGHGGVQQDYLTTRWQHILVAARR